jgi:hypothetical protein
VEEVLLAVGEALVHVAGAAGYFALHFAMKDGMIPKRAPISFAAVLKRTRGPRPRAPRRRGSQPRRRRGRSPCAGPRWGCRTAPSRPSAR